MEQGATAPPRPGKAKIGVSSIVDNMLERLEDGEIVRDAEIETGVFRGTQGPAGKGYSEKSKTFWQVKSAENRAAGAGMKLKFHQNLLAATEISVSEDVWQKSASEWLFTLVGWVFGARLVLGKLKGYIRAKWGDERMVTVAELKPGIFIFKFAKEEDSNRILNLGPWSFDSRPLVLKHLIEEQCGQYTWTHLDIGEPKLGSASELEYAGDALDPFEFGPSQDIRDPRGAGGGHNRDD